MEKTKKCGKLRRTLKIAGLTLAGLIVLAIAALFAVRGVNAIRINIGGDGVQEKIFVTLGGCEQFVSIRGNNTNNPVVIALHGGPGSPDGFMSYTYQPALEDGYTFIRWDQRGSGRTYYKSPEAPLSLENLLGDLDDLVDYAAQRFGRPIYIVGHSWGTVLGLEYAAAHPDKIAGYVGIGQMTDDVESARLQALAAAKAARAAGKNADAARIEALFAEDKPFYDEDFDIGKFSELRTLENRYLDPDAKSPILPALFSPDFGWNDLRYQLLLMRDSEGHITRQKPLLTALSGFKPPEELDIPAAFIGGERDFVCATVLAREYAESLNAPFYEMKGLGHSPMFSGPEAFAKTLREALTGLK